MTQYSVALATETITGAPTWNPNGSLQKLVVMNPLNTADAQTCTYNGETRLVATDPKREDKPSKTSWPALDRKLYIIAQFAFLFFWLKYCIHLIRRWPAMDHGFRIDASDFPLLFLWLWIPYCAKRAAVYL